MKADDTLKDGMYAQTVGYYSVNDGGGSLYKVRTITNDDVVDNMTIIALYDNNLIAELIPTSPVNVKSLGAYGDNTHDDTTPIQTALTKYKSIFMPNGNYKVQYLLMETGDKIFGESYNTKLKQISNVDESNYPYIINIKSNQTNIEICNLYLIGSGQNDENKRGGIGHIDNTNWGGYSTIHDVKIQYCSGTGIYLGEKVQEYKIHNIEIRSMGEYGILCKGSDNQFNQMSIGAINKTGLHCGDCNLITSVKCWVCNMLKEDYYGLNIGNDCIVSSYYSQQNNGDAIMIRGSGNKIDFVSDMDGYNNATQTSDIAILKFVQGSNYNNIDGDVTQGRSGFYFNYLLKFMDNGVQVGNNIKLSVNNIDYSHIDINIKNQTAMHPSNIIVVNNKDYTYKATNYFTSGTQMGAFTSNNAGYVLSTLNNVDGGYSYTYSVGLNSASYLFFGKSLTGLTDSKKIFVSYKFDSDIVNGGYQFNRPSIFDSTHSVYIDSSSGFIRQRNKWIFNGVFIIPANRVASQIRLIYSRTERDESFEYSTNPTIAFNDLYLECL